MHPCGHHASDVDWSGAGWFSLNVPSGLTIYWFINNVLSTAQQVHPPRPVISCTGYMLLFSVLGCAGGAHHPPSDCGTSRVSVHASPEGKQQ